MVGMYSAITVAIVCNVEQQKTTTKWETVEFRNLKSIDGELFHADIQSSSILCDTSGSLDDITQRYISGLSELLDSHAPLVQRTQISRPHAIWYNQTNPENKAHQFPKRSSDDFKKFFQVESSNRQNC